MGRDAVPDHFHVHPLLSPHAAEEVTTAWAVVTQGVGIMLEIIKSMWAGSIHVPGEPGFSAWAAVRRAERACDGALTGTTRVWLRRLPPRRRPVRLCALYPRVANRLAWSWSSAEASALLLDELCADRRGGRRGFPTCVTRELRRLQQFNLQQRGEIAPEPFLATVDRVLGRG